MKSVEEKAEQINLLLSPRCISRKEVAGNGEFIKYLQTAVVIKHPETFHKMIKKIILCGAPPPLSKTFSVVQKSVGEKGDSFAKCLNTTRKCHDNLSFRLAYLERLLLEDQINMREFKQFKSILIKQQLDFIRDFAKKSQEKTARINAKTLKPLDKKSAASYQEERKSEHALQYLIPTISKPR